MSAERHTTPTTMVERPMDPAGSSEAGGDRTRLALATWSNAGLGTLAAAGIGAVFGVVAGWLMPRGPVTTIEALASIAAALLVGLVAGLVSGTRWSLVATPFGTVLAFEIVRIGITGPTVDGIEPGSMYGMIAVVAGRGVAGLLMLLPMLVGVPYGLYLARRLGDDRADRLRRTGLRRTGWALTVIGSVAIVALAVVVARPASTAPILGPDGEPLEGSVAELTDVEIGGVDQTVLIRGRDADDPVLLFLAGGPGGTELGAMRDDVGLEADFVVVTWDQRGTGGSYAAIDPVGDMTVERSIADTIELTEYLRARFDEERIYLVGNSWGTTLGVLAAERRPDLYHAFVGTGQMVSQRATDVMFWEDTRAWAVERGRDGLVSTLDDLGPPPYDRMLDYEPGVFAHVYDWGGYPEHDGSKELPYTLFVPEYSLMDRVNAMRGLLDTFSVLYPQLQDVDFRRDVPSLDIPVYLAAGVHEARGRATLAEEWYAMLEAPSKDWITFEHSGHRPSFEEPAEFAALMRRVVVETYG